MNIWRIHLESDSNDNIDPRQFCLENNFVEVGWEIEGQALTIVREGHYYKHLKFTGTVRSVKNRSLLCKNSPQKKD